MTAYLEQRLDPIYIFDVCVYK